MLDVDLDDDVVSRLLALAIGWREDYEDPDVITVQDAYTRERKVCVWHECSWTSFDYRDPAVIWPIAKRFNAFPIQGEDGIWESFCQSEDGAGEYVAKADTAEGACAISIILSRNDHRVLNDVIGWNCRDVLREQFVFSRENWSAAAALLTHGAIVRW